MNKPIAIGVGLLLLVLLLLFSTTFTVKYNEVAVRATFGQADADSVITDAGLHFRFPVFIDRVTKFDTRLQLVESPLEMIETSDGMQIVVRAFMLWRVDKESEGPLQFLKSYRSIDRAGQLVWAQVRTAFTGSLSQYEFNDLIGEESRLAEAETAIRSELAVILAERGIDPVTVGISEIVLPPKTSEAVMSEMQATRNVLAEGERERGKAEADRIRHEGNTTAEKILAFAGARAEEIRASGAERKAEYIRQMAEDEELAIFLLWLDALEQTLGPNTTIVLPTEEIAPFHLLNPQVGTPEGGRIPQPSGRDSAARSSAERGEADGGAAEGDAPESDAIATGEEGS